MEKEQKTLNFSVFDYQQSLEIPDFIEKNVSGKDYVYYGEKNKLPFYLYDLYEKSSLMNSIVNTTVSFVLGNGINSDLLYVNDKGESLEEFINDIALDYMLFGGFAFQIIYNKLGEVNELYWLDFRKTRVNKEITKAYYSNEFDMAKSKPEYIEYDIWKPGDNKGSKVFYFNGTNRSVYPVPRYSGSIRAIETSIRIDSFHLNSIRNNFNADMIINFNNGIPDDETQHTIEKQIKDKFCGDENGTRFMLTWNDSKDNGVTVERIADDKFDQKYSALKESTILSVFTGFSAPQQLFGYAIQGNVFNKEEYDQAFDLYNRLQIQPIQKLFVTIFNKIYNATNKIEFIPFALDSNENEQNEQEVEEKPDEKLNPDENE